MIPWKETREAMRAAVAEHGARLGKDAIDEMAVPSYLQRGVVSRTVFWRKLRYILRAADLKPNTRVFDFGCGTGVLLAPLSAEGRHVQATDLHLELARAVVERLKLSRVELFGPEQWRERVPTGQVETIIAANVLEHVEDRRELLSALAGKLSRTGRIVISGPTENRLYRLGRALLGFSGDYHVTTIHEVLQDAEAIGLRRIYLKRWPLPGPGCLYQIAAYVR